MHLKKIVIAIDGYSACGKSTTAKQVAGILGYRYIDSGAMYRAVTLFFLDHHVSLTNPKEVSKALQQIQITFKVNSKNASETFLNGLNVEKQIRNMRISENVSQVSTLKDVRLALVDQQRRMGKEKGVVMDGRDIGTVVFPNADVKIFMTASPEIRAHRRFLELKESGIIASEEEILNNLIKRDHEDSTRAEAPLIMADDAVLIDNSHLTHEEQLQFVMELVNERIVETGN